MDFPGFLGNAGVKEAISAAFASGRFPHAIILQGETGCGKRTLAGLIARALVCRDREHAPLRGMPRLCAGRCGLASGYPRGGRERGDPLP